MPSLTALLLSFSTLSALVLGLTRSVESSTLTIHHRLLSPSAPAPFVPRLEVQLKDLTLVQSVQDLSSGHPLGPVDLGRDIYYQVAIQRAGQPETDWSITSVKACHLLPSTGRKETFELSVPFSGGDETSIQLSYSLSGISRDGSCPPVTPGSVVSSTSPTDGFETNVQVVKAGSPTPLILASPVKLDAATGQAEVPPVEKTLIQKYWIYAVIPLAVLLLMPETEAERAAAAKK
ncbi:hypothetical protein [Phaffia rhodozyma]|uniref:ER membrane protein complex subunit 10 n=1 Tax=Phaffia rhodozyma TaxID=264483 RepID=A0A0F7SHE1_PHARH|nr:hypothetical protein [Phaffia rhodozyma]